MRHLIQLCSICMFLASPLSALELYIARHGETQWNLEKLAQGQLDIPLNATGLYQAEQLSERLSAVTFDAAYASDLSRAYDTARIVLADRGLDLTQDPRLRELSFGIYEGLPVTADLRELVEPLLYDEGDGPNDGVERLRDFNLRVHEVLDELIAAHTDDERVLVVCHGGVIRSYLDRLPLAWGGERPVRIPNACYFVLHVDDEGDRLAVKLDGWNGTPDPLPPIYQE